MARPSQASARKQLAASSLSVFLLASLAAHAVLLLVLGSPGPVTVPVRPGDHLLVVELGQMTVTNRPRATAVHRAPATRVAPSPGTAQGGNTSAANTINHVLGEIHTRLSRYLVYPPLARARGWQGTVMLEFTLVPDGRLEHIQVAQSSGYDVLDRAAMDALARVARLDPDTGNGVGLPLAMRLPVIYRLTER